MRDSRETEPAFLFLYPQLIEHQASHTGQNNHQDRMNLEFPSQAKGNRKDQITFVVNKILLVHEQQGSCSDQAYCSGAQS